MLKARFGVELYERNFLIIFDEVQKYPTARELTKYLVEDGRYDYLLTGSLIRIKKYLRYNYSIRRRKNKNVSLRF